ncbi:hypothetical protein GUITHDRAFT_152546, partial [Guillardia theta CCMP2712]
MAGLELQEASKQFLLANEESDRLSAELAAYKKESMLLRDEIDRLEREERELTASLAQAGFSMQETMRHTCKNDSLFASIQNYAMSTYDSRLKTFRQWPHAAAMRPLATPAALASQGFYFSPNDQYKDRVLCAFCNLELAEWGPKDDPAYEHNVRSPTCPVVTGKIMAIQSRDPEFVEEMIHEEAAAVAKLQVLQMGMQKQLDQYMERIKSDKQKRAELEKALAMYRQK